MQFLDTTQSLAWLRDHAPAAEPGRLDDLYRTEAYVERWPAHDLRALARRATGWLLRRGSPQGLVLIRDPHVIPSREDLYLYHLVRRESLNTQSVDEAPGHVFESHERAAVESLLWLALSFGWGFIAAAQGSPDAVTADNDGHLRFHSPEPGELDTVREWLAGRGAGE